MSIINTLTGCAVDAASVSTGAGHFRPNVNVYAISNFYSHLFFQILSFNIKLFEINYSTGICILNLEYFNIKANNTRKKTYAKIHFFKIKFIVIITQFFSSLGDTINKVTLKFTPPKYLPLNLHNTHQFIKKMQGTRE